MVRTEFVCPSTSSVRSYVFFFISYRWVGWDLCLIFFVIIFRFVSIYFFHCMRVTKYKTPHAFSIQHQAYATRMKQSPRGRTHKRTLPLVVPPPNQFVSAISPNLAPIFPSTLSPVVAGAFSTFLSYGELRNRSSFFTVRLLT